MTRTLQDLQAQVIRSLGTDRDDFDVMGIVYYLRDTFDVLDIEEISHDDYWAVVMRHNILL